MKTLENPDDKKELLQRLAELRGGSARVWGKMSAPQMKCHLNDSYRLYRARNLRVPWRIFSRARW